MQAQSVLEILKEKYVGKEVTIFIENIEDNEKYVSLYDYGVHDFIEECTVSNVTKKDNTYYLVIFYNQIDYSLPLKRQ